MSNLKEKLTKGGVTAVIVITILAVCYGLSWIVTCGIIKLITMCFGLTFKWSIATLHFKIGFQCNSKEIKAE